MPVKVQCSAGHLMMVPDHRAGTVLRCPKCGIEVHVPGEAAGTAKMLSPAKLQAPPLSRGAAPPAISGAGEQSPQVAGHSTAARSGISQTGPRLISRPRVKPPKLVSQDNSPTPEEPPSQVPPAPAVSPAEIPVNERQLRTAEPIDVPPPPSADENVWADEPAQAKVPSRAAEPPKAPVSRHTTVNEPKRSPSSRPRTTLTGTMLAPEVSAEPEAAEPTTSAKSALPSMAAAVRVPLSEPTIEYKQPEPLIEPPLAAPPPVVGAPEPVLSFHSAATQVEPDLPPPPAPPLVVAYGPQPTASQRVTVWQLAAALLAAALLSIGPSLWELGDYLRSDGEQSVARWAFFLLVLGVVQVGTLIILVQVPDWSSVWIVTVQSLVLAAIYAAILGLTVITGGDSTLIGALSLDHQYNTGKAPMWCVCLAATYACLAFFAGRFSAKWRKILRQMQAADESAYAH